MSFFQKNSSSLILITRSSSFFDMHVSVDFKNDVEKDSTLLLFFFSSKSPAGHAISRQKHLELTVVSTYLLLELFYIGMPVVKTDGRLDGRTVT